MKPRVFKRGGWWRQIGPGLTMHAAPTIPSLTAVLGEQDHDEWCVGLNRRGPGLSDASGSAHRR
jgi:hypothetical protein